MQELDLSLTIITETWFYECESLRNLDISALNGSAVSFVHRCRKKKKRSNPGGGISIAFRKSRVSLKEFRFKRKQYELLCAHGKIVNNSRPIYIFGVYISPGSKAANYHECLELLSDAILKVKTSVREAYIVVGGDLNRRDIHEAIGDYANIHVLTSTATRGDSTLDISACNFHNELVKTIVTEPLTSTSETASDHSFVSYHFALKHKHDFHWIRYKIRRVTEEWNTMYNKMMRAMDWSFDPLLTPSQVADLMHKNITQATEHCFPLRSIKI